MSNLDATALIDLSHCLQRAEALVQTLAEAVSEHTANGNHMIMIEMIEEYILRARKSLGED